MAEDEVKVDEVAAEAAADEAPAEEPEAEGAPRVAEPLHPERLVEVEFLRDAPWCTGTPEGAVTETIPAGEVRTFPHETAQVFVGMGAAAWVGGDEVAVDQGAERATRSRRRRK
jgi:hypothetical protein